MTNNTGINTSIDGKINASESDAIQEDAAGTGMKRKVENLSSASSASSTNHGNVNISIASVASAAQFSTSMGYHGLGSILSSSLLTSSAISSSSSASSSTASVVVLPTKESCRLAASKAVNESPPFVHLSKTDSAPQLKITNSKTSSTTGNMQAQISVNDHLACKQGEGEMRGYRMTRASHGVNTSAGSYYYEVIIQKPPTVKELANSLPSNVRLGPKLQREMQQALILEEEYEAKVKKENEHTIENDAKFEGKKDNYQIKAQNNSIGFGSHVRLGWSMRTGDLQAPVGYDKWSYAVRSIGGSKINCSYREDNWGGESFGPGDVVGCGISMENENHIRFFCNGLPMGEFVISKGKREGGTAFIVPDGVYYPAVSLYMGATVKVNFGPKFIFPPRKLPAGLKFRPMSSLCKQPASVEESWTKVTKEKIFRKADTQQKFLDLVQTEARVVMDAYQNHRKKHIIDVWNERTNRKLKTDDLENDEYFIPLEIN